MAYDWPGNVRELENVLTRAAINTHGELILDESLSLLVDKADFKEKEDIFIMPSLQEVEKEHIKRVLEHTHWHLGKTCDFLCISRPTLRQKMKEYGIVASTPDSE